MPMHSAGLCEDTLRASANTLCCHLWRNCLCTPAASDGPPAPMSRRAPGRVDTRKVAPAEGIEGGDRLKQTAGARAALRCVCRTSRGVPGPKLPLEGVTRPENAADGNQGWSIALSLNCLSQDGYKCAYMCICVCATTAWADARASPSQPRVPKSVPTSEQGRGHEGTDAGTRDRHEMRRCSPVLQAELRIPWHRRMPAKSLRVLLAHGPQRRREITMCSLPICDRAPPALIVPRRHKTKATNGSVSAHFHRRSCLEQYRPPQARVHLAL